MKLKNALKIFTGIVTITLPATFFLSACSSNNYIPDIEEQNALDHFKFINDRTISLMSEVQQGNQISFMFGTGWLFDYNEQTQEYYVATNMHVAQPMVDFTTSATYKYGYIKEYDPSPSTTKNTLQWSDIPSQSDFKNFTSFALAYRYNIDNSNPDYYHDNSNVFTPDMAILKVKFDSRDSYFNQRLTNFRNSKNQDNRYYKFYDWGNTRNFYQNAISSKTSDNSDLIAYVSGFPSTSSSGNIQTTLTCAYAEMESYYQYRLTDNSDPNNKVSLNEYGNNISSFETNNVTYYGQQNYVSFYQTIDDQSIPYNPYYLTGGSSGSLVINENYEVLGIYWGGWGIGNNPDHFDQWMGSFATFNGYYYDISQTNLRINPTSSYNFVDSFYSYI